MSKRLQVLVSEEEYETLRAVASRQHVSVGEWVRVALRGAVAQSDVRPAHEKIHAIRIAQQYSFPVADIDVMNQEIAEGACSGLH